ncbi:MAG TPA: glycoside hydrolase family 125 protein [Candidatus Limnocylindria bacterium]
MGTGAICASFDPGSAAWLSVGMAHIGHGFVELSALPPFDDSLRGDPVATRRHRLAMTEAAHAFLVVELDGSPPALDLRVADVDAPAWSGAGVTVVASAEPSGALCQRWSIPRGAGQVRVRLRGRLDRPSLAEITELNPPSPTGATTTLEPADGTVTVSAPALPATVVVTVRGAPIDWARVGGELVGTVGPEGRDPLELEIVVATPGVRTMPVVTTREPDRLAARAVAYVRGCTALRVADGERAILTDHRILPLSWTRDAYWQALALLAANAPGDRERVADHLRWLWRRCERPDGRWVRSHHANGRRKDLAFQADQQLYPFVELADYWRLTGELPAGVDWHAALDVAWAATMGAIDPGSGLITSTETAADDPAAAPFIGASQVLLWYAAERLAEVAPAASIDPAALADTARRARNAFERHHAAGGDAWAYAVDGHGVRVAYHDANDLPTALAPLWGFCRADDPGWRATMDFAFSPANPAWFAGHRAGLGSVHTPGAWTLGDLQAWLRARLVGDQQEAAAALARLHEAAFSDGMLPEAYGTEATTRIRHWFAWPGAALAALRILDRNGRLEPMLAVARR